MVAWPKVRVEFWDPTIVHQILTREEAQHRFGVNPKLFDDIGLAGVGIPNERTLTHPEAEKVRTLWKYTEEDCIRDNARALLMSCEALVRASPYGYDYGRETDYCRYCEARYDTKNHEGNHEDDCDWAVAYATVQRAKGEIP